MELRAKRLKLIHLQIFSSWSFPIVRHLYRQRLNNSIPSICSEGLFATIDDAREFINETGFKVLDGCIFEKPGYRQAQNDGYALTETKWKSLNDKAWIQERSAPITEKMKKKARCVILVYFLYHKRKVAQMNYTHLTQGERYQIYALKKAGFSLRNIAKRIVVDFSKIKQTRKRLHHIISRKELLCFRHRQSGISDEVTRK